MLNGNPLPASASIRDFQRGMAGYMADAMEQALLLPEDMAKPRSMIRHEVFLNLKRYLAMVCPLLVHKRYLAMRSSLASLSFSNPCFFLRQVVQASFRVEEITNYYHRQMKEEEGRRNATIKAFNVAKRSIQKLKKKLLEEERERKSAAAALDSAKKQVEGKRVLIRNAKD